MGPTPRHTRAHIHFFQAEGLPEDFPTQPVALSSRGGRGGQGKQSKTLLHPSHLSSPSAPPPLHQPQHLLALKKHSVKRLKQLADEDPSSMASLSKGEQRRKGKGTMPLLLLLLLPPEHPAPACRAVATGGHSSSRLIVGPRRTRRAGGTDPRCQRRRPVAPLEVEGSRMEERGVKSLAAAAGVGNPREVLSLHHLSRPPRLLGWLFFSPPSRPRG